MFSIQGLFRSTAKTSAVLLQTRLLTGALENPDYRNRAQQVERERGSEVSQIWVQTIVPLFT